MRICILNFEGCPNHELTFNRVNDVLSRLGIEATVEEVELTDPGQVEALRFLGSPTVQINDNDIEPDARSRRDFAHSCRLYEGSGVPAAEMLEAAIKEAEKPLFASPRIRQRSVNVRA